MDDETLTDSDRIRALHAEHPEWSQARLARETGASRGLVHAAINRTPGVGRPSAHRRITIVVPRALDAYICKRLEDGVYSGIADVLRAAAEAELVPPAEWEAYQAAVRAAEDRASRGPKKPAISRGSKKKRPRRKK